MNQYLQKGSAKMISGLPIMAANKVLNSDFSSHNSVLTPNPPPALPPPPHVVYATDRSKAVVPILSLLLYRFVVDISGA